MHFDFSWEFLLYCLIAVVVLFVLLTVLSRLLKISFGRSAALVVFIWPIYEGYIALTTGKSLHHRGGFVSMESLVAVGALSCLAFIYVLYKIIKDKVKAARETAAKLQQSQQMEASIANEVVPPDTQSAVHTGDINNSDNVKQR